MPSQMNKQRIKKITRLLRGPILIVLFLAAVACNAESTAIPVPAPVPTEVPTATAEPTAPSDPTANPTATTVATTPAAEAPTARQVREGISSPEPTATPTATTAAATPEPEHPYQENFWSDANIAEARSALDRGEDIQVPDEEGMTSLHVAAASTQNRGWWSCC